MGGAGAAPSQGGDGATPDRQACTLVSHKAHATRTASLWEQGNSDPPCEGSGVVPPKPCRVLVALCSPGVRGCHSCGCAWVLATSWPGALPYRATFSQPQPRRGPQPRRYLLLQVCEQWG